MIAEEVNSYGHLSFRLPGDLVREMKRLADIDRRSVSKEVVVALEEFVKRRNTRSEDAE